ncbi:MAG TPA: AsmA-like C-terminal region-containing protein, partial [Lacipirellulaceae bacterium]|nr:AsmA-like C-terminal region-containing protein [Lacipirellulaceae bacterium]
VMANAKNDKWYWVLENVEGRGVTDNTTVTCRGGAKPDGTGCDTDLTIEAADVPLDDMLKNSLTPAGQRAWEELQPQGRVDFTAHVKKHFDEAVPQIEVVLRPQGHTVSIDPRLFPYRLEQIQGQAVYQRNHVQLLKIAAQHDRTLYSVESGTWDVTQDGGWQLAFKNLTADRLSMGRDLVVALPPGLRSIIERFQPSGTFALYNSSLSITKSPQFAGLASAWDVNLECQQAAIQGAAPLRGVTGGVHLVGRSDGRTAVTAGELALDSLLWNDVQLTNVRGPLWTDSSHFLLGEPACLQENQPARRVTADAYGGSVAANIELLHDMNPSYKLDLHLGGVSLARFVHERLGGPTDMSGMVSGNLAVSGTGQTVQTLSGGGEMHLVNGNIYQLPPLVAILKLLSSRPPSTTAFNRCDVKFAVQGEHVHFEQLNLLGDAVSLYGNGDADFNRKLKLVFYTLIGPADLPIPLWKTIAGHVSQQGLQIKVVGTLDDPKVEKEPFPAVKDILGRMKGELQDGAATMSSATASRGTRYQPR